MKGTPHSVDARDGCVQLCNDEDSHYEMTFETSEELDDFIKELRVAGRRAFGTPPDA